MTRLLKAREAADLGLIYAIRCEAFVKIGWTQKLRNRQSQIQACNPFKLKLLGTISGNVGDERHLQLVLERYKERGEWFAYTGDVVWACRFIKWYDDIDYVIRLISDRDFREQEEAKRPKQKQYHKPPAERTDEEIEALRAAVESIALGPPND